MKKNILIGLFLQILIIGIFSGCNSMVINLEKKEFLVPVGESISTDVKDYVRASDEMLEAMTLDISGVNTDVIGTYTATITYEDEVKKFTIIVADENAPEMEVASPVINIDTATVLNVEDVIKSITDHSDFEYGFSNDRTLADKDKSILPTMSFGTAGTYIVEVLAKDIYDNYSVEEIKVVVGTAGVESEVEPVETVDYKDYMNTNEALLMSDLEKYDQTAVSFGIGNTVDTTTNRPDLAYYTQRYGEFAVDFIQPESQYVWLTFNEIAEYGTTSHVLDTLKEKEVKAVFFITLSYAKNNPELIQRMIDEGHVLGNYTASCSKVPELSLNNLTNELDTLYNYVYQTYGYEMYLFRTPSGNFSQMALAVAQSKGYRTVFWSFNYVDWNVNAQPDVTEALNNALTKVHGGAIYLLSGSSSTNQQMLGDLIDGIREKGYDFGVYQNN